MGQHAKFRHPTLFQETNEGIIPLVTRRRLLPFVALVMLLCSVVSTEAAEVWCRVAVGATVDTDDDDGPCFTGSQNPSFSQVPSSASAHFRPALPNVQAACVSAPNKDSIVDEPTFTLPQFGVAVSPGVFPRVVFPTYTATYGVDTHGPSAETVRFIRPPPRAPPVS